MRKLTLRHWRRPGEWPQGGGPYNAPVGSGQFPLQLAPPDQGDDWTGLTGGPLPIDQAVSWAVLPRCGGVTCFVGTTRDHSEGRPGVTQLAYEVYRSAAEERLGQIAASTRRRWPALGRIALLHRVGTVALSEASVVVVCSAPHREEAFAAARYGIDTLKETVPIWKRETWAGGEDWSTCVHQADEVPPSGLPGTPAP